MFVFVIKKKEKRDPLLDPRGGCRLLGNRFRCGFRGIAVARQFDTADHETGEESDAAGNADHFNEGEVFLVGVGGFLVFHFLILSFMEVKHDTSTPYAHITRIIYIQTKMKYTNNTHAYAVMRMRVSLVRLHVSV